MSSDSGFSDCEALSRRRACAVVASRHRRCMAGVTAALCFAATVHAGTWTQFPHPAPSSVGLMLLLSDGTVMAQDPDVSDSWYRLTPDGHGSYVNGTWTALAPMHDTRLYFSSDVLKDGRVFVAGGEYGTCLLYTSDAADERIV